MHPNPASETASAAPAAGRDQQGRFAPGNKLGTGNPFARQVAALRKAFLDGVTAEDIAAIAAALLARAKEGDVAAAKVVLAYTVGKAEATVDPDRLDIDEWQNFKDDAAIVSEELRSVLGKPEGDLVLTVLRSARPGITKACGETLVQGLYDSLPARFKATLRSPSPNGSNGRRSPAKAAVAIRPSANGQRPGKQPSPSPNGLNGAG